MYGVSPRTTVDDQAPTIADIFALSSRDMELMAGWSRRASKYERQEQKMKSREDVMKKKFKICGEVPAAKGQVFSAVNVAFFAKKVVWALSYCKSTSS